MTEIIQITDISKVYKRVRQIESRNQAELFWALKDINLSISEGEIVGFIGKNGAGKSTLLKILSRITSPTSGTISLNGRVGSLLEVGTGFHPEMTGRENIYMNGNILGMNHQEITRKLDSIIDFSGVSQFIDTPIKRYSSGMQARLAFSVAAHLEPEIMIIDEVLAVGDAEFQKRCLGKMQEIGQEGRTVLFVSHNMNAIRNLCTRCVWLKDGKVVQDADDVHAVINKYLSEMTRNVEVSNYWSCEVNNTFHLKDIRPIALYLIDGEGVTVNRVISGSELVFLSIQFECLHNLFDLSVGYALYDTNSNLVFMTYATDSHMSTIKDFSKGVKTMTSRLPVDILNDGEYTIQLIAGIHQSHPILSRDESLIMIKFTVEGNTNRSSYWRSLRPSVVAPVVEWTVK